MAVAKKKSPPVVVPTTKIVLCGPHTVYWLTADAQISPEILDKKIFAEEKDLAKKIKAKERRDEFVRARWLYHNTTKQNLPLLRTPQGYPKWPDHLQGSISHKCGHVMFTKVPNETHYSIGLDLEMLSKIKPNMEPKICSPAEIEVIDSIMHDPFRNRLELLAIIFSVKEAIFKAHFPLGKKHFGFHDVSVLSFDFERKEVKVRLNVKTSNETPKDHLMVTYFNWITYNDEKYVITTAEERRPIVVENDLKIDDEEGEAKKEPAAANPAVPEADLDLAVDS